MSATKNRLNFTPDENRVLFKIWGRAEIVRGANSPKDAGILFHAKISNEMTAQGMHRSTEEITKRILYLTNTYKAYKTKLQSGKVDKIKWEFYDTIDTIMNFASDLQEESDDDNGDEMDYEEEEDDSDDSGNLDEEIPPKSIEKTGMPIIKNIVVVKPNPLLSVESKTSEVLPSPPAVKRARRESPRVVAAQKSLSDDSAPTTPIVSKPEQMPVAQQKITQQPVVASNQVTVSVPASTFNQAFIIQQGLKDQSDSKSSNAPACVKLTQTSIASSNAAVKITDPSTPGTSFPIIDKPAEKSKPVTVVCKVVVQPKKEKQETVENKEKKTVVSDLAHPEIRDLLKNMVTLSKTRLELEQNRMNHQERVGAEIIEMLRRIAQETAPKSQPMSE